MDLESHIADPAELDTRIVVYYCSRHSPLSLHQAFA